MKKIHLPDEIVFLIATVLLAFSIALSAAADFGLSMIASPAYILCQKFTFLSFGLSSYLVEALLFVLFCIVMKKVRVVYFLTFLTDVIYSVVLDLVRYLIPFLNPSVTAPGSMGLTIRILLFVSGMILTSLSVSLFFRVYLYPQICDVFVRDVSLKYHANRTKFKRLFDASCLIISIFLSLVFFHKLVGIGVGTIVITLLNSFLIGFFDRLLEKTLECYPLLKRFASYVRNNQ